jgi:tetratricopeptide (TPR) repeat protein
MVNRSERRKRAKAAKVASRKSGSRFDPHGEELRRAVNFMQSRNHAEAERTCRGILARSPEHPEANHILGVLHLQRGDFDDAARFLDRAVAGDPRNAGAQANLGAALSSLGRLDEAVAALQAAIRLNPEAIEGYNNLAQIELRRENPDAALSLYRKALQISPRNPQLNANLANALLAVDRVEQSIPHYRHALDVMPNFAEAHYGLAQALRDAGDMENAKHHYERAMALDPNHANAMLSFAMIADSITAEQEARIRAAHKRASDNSEKFMLLSFALGKIEDTRKNFSEAFGHYRRGNLIRQQQLRYTNEQTRREFRQLISVFDRQFFAERADFGVPDNRPIFILGMPRSGTTLVEQILASHSRITGMGELSCFPRSVFDTVNRVAQSGFPSAATLMSKADVATLAATYLKDARNGIPDDQMHTDKLPANFIFVGMIRLAFPNARIIHCTRDPRDTSISLFRTFFPSGGHHFSYDLDLLREYHDLYEQLMEHWSSLFGDAITEVNYEKLVLSPDTEIRRLIDELGLEFEENCLEFHKTRRVVRTASAVEVRKPIFKSSVGSWNRYERSLPDTWDSAKSSP